MGNPMENPSFPPGNRCEDSSTYPLVNLRVSLGDSSGKPHVFPDQGASKVLVLALADGDYLRL
jgi:hypothetical protein